ncbi:MAG TPA: DUF4350 domain-containing protein [Candidatus Saccharimonadia bacterium]|nr:DUF4350 domain-containing protein [Candidatus Saccharimonadia bacterium]
MRRSPATALAILIGLVLVSAWAFNSLLGKRFASGEVYAPGSSLRSDPLGSKALHNSLNRITGMQVERNFRDLTKLKGNRDTTLLCIMVTPDVFTDGEELDGESLMRFANEGGRLVITLNGQTTGWDVILNSADERRDENAKRRRDERRKQLGKKPISDDKGSDKKKDGKDSTDEDSTKKDKDLKNEDNPFMPPKSLQQMLGVKVAQENFVMTPKGALTLETPLGLGVEKGTLPGWHTRTSMTFDDEAKGKWKVLGQVNNDVMLASRDTEAGGSIVLATDSYFLTNEALYREPSTKFLSWLIGAANTVVFEETHLGTQEDPGIMALARRHRLHGLFLGGMLLFALFVWKSSMSLVPSRDDDAPSRTVAGRGATAGLVSLLRRGIPLAQVLRRGLDAYENSTRQRSTAMQTRIDQARQHLPMVEATSVRKGALRSIYLLMCGMLHPSATPPPIPAPQTPPLPQSETAPAPSHD